MSAIEPAAILLPLVLTKIITHEEADTLCAALINQPIPKSTIGVLKQLEDILGRKLT